MITLADRLAGGIWGHLVGDALGVPYEFQPAAEIGEVKWGHRGTHRQPPGTWSDDGGLMLALLDSLLSGGFDLDDQGRRALAWLDGPDYKPGVVFDVGMATSNSLRRIRSGAPAASAGGTSESDNGNGALMRILPIALVGHQRSEEDLVAQAMAASAVTHGHARSKVTCAAYVLIAKALLAGAAPAVALEAATSTLSRLLDGADALELQLLMAYTKRSGSGYVVDCFWSAWEAFESASSYAEAVERAISWGNDTDTTACVAGGLAGIRWGRQGIPSQWIEGMRGKEIVDSLVARLNQTNGAR